MIQWFRIDRSEFGPNAHMLSYEGHVISGFAYSKLNRPGTKAWYARRTREIQAREAARRRSLRVGKQAVRTPLP